MISSKPTLRLICFKVLLDVVLIRCKDPRSTIVQIDLHDAKPRRVSWSMAHVDARSNLQEITMEWLPVEIKGEVFGQVHSDVEF